LDIYLYFFLEAFTENINTGELNKSIKLSSIVANKDKEPHLIAAISCKLKRIIFAIIELYMAV
jgi:hypothetical protein